MREYRRFILPAVVFITGACVLVIELVATRILSPFFGNTIYTVSSIVGVVLAALSFGYYIGGRLADKHPSRKLFYSIIAAGGATVVLVQATSLAILPSLSESLSLSSGPLVSSLVLFLVPSVLLGMLSPFAIKLQQSLLPDTGIGTIAGGMFFWSTLGSIAGSLSTGFVLIPQFGIDNIMLGTGFVLLALGLIPVLWSSSRQIRLVLSGTFILAIVLSLQLPTMAQIINKDKNVVYSKDGIYEKITIYDGMLNGRPTRFFQQDRSWSGAMYLNSDELAVDYTKYSSLYKVFTPNPKQALVIGGGAYSIPKALLRDLPNATIDVSEIEPSLFELSKKYFRLPASPRLQNFTEDGRRLLEKSGKNYDMIFSDVYYSLYSIPAHFTTREFFDLANDRLNTDGIFIANMIGSLSREQPSLILSEMRTFKQSFPNSYFFATTAPGSNELQNIMFVGSKSSDRVDLNRPDIVNSPDPIIRNLANAEIDSNRFNLSSYPLLTDNYAPVDQMTSSLLRLDPTSKGKSRGENMMQLIRQQLAYGPRYMGSKGHEQTADFLLKESRAIAGSDGTVTEQRWQEKDSQNNSFTMRNILLSLQPENRRRLIIGTHYDSKRTADRDPDDPKAAVPGANDSASGVAAMIEIARAMAADIGTLPVGIDFVFFDGEEGFPYSGSDTGTWQPLGSNYFASNLAGLYADNKPEGGIVLDMVCDRNLGIMREGSSLQYAPKQTRRFFDIGNSIAPGAFLAATNDRIADDHTALNRAGIPSFLVIDFEYPAFHTRRDTAAQCSAQSLNTVTDTVLRYVYSL